MTSSTKQSQRHIHSVLAALDLLECFERKPNLTIKQIIDYTGMTRNRIMRLTGTYEERGYLIRNRSTGKYQLGPKIMLLGKIHERNFDLVQLVRPLLKEVSFETGESASLYIIDGTERLLLAREEGTHAIRYSVTEGQRLPLFAGAGGKVLLAYGPESLKKIVLAQQNVSPLTLGTIVDAGDLAAEIQTVRAKGFAVSQAERASDAGSIAAPVFGYKHELICAIAIVGPVSRVNVDSHPEYVLKVVATANGMSRLLEGDDAVSNGQMNALKDIVQK